MNKIDKMNKIFKFFEDNVFANLGEWRRDINLVFEFADWIDSDDGKGLIIEEFGREKLEEIRGEFDKGINAFLEEWR